ncbi:MAG: ammonia-forming cytochrome c nitrite reductase subunit c552 [Gemmatimonadetes bacterium]|nr:ammonia-forming cytochrome c nitrite reductase subunit c552 [Gemmatimonadota bacterium]MYF72888.1 ammonia-forming cytochrome c nitrite reductase subunit c552 [Gemmatimonadota bacterium]
MRFGIFHILWVILVFASCSREREVPNLVRVSEPGFTGLERCAACHTDKYAEWRQSLHSVAMTVPSDSTIVGDFGNVSHVYGGVRSRMFRRGGAYYMQTEGEDGRAGTYRVDYAIGKRQHQAYLTAFPNGRWQVLPLYHDGATNDWVDAQEGGVVAQSRPLAGEDYYYWTNAGRTWNFHCFDCHASRVQKHYDVPTQTYRTTVGSLSIDCEACHGPSGKHDETRGQVDAPLHLLLLRSLDKERSVEVCAQCHAAKEIVATGYLPGENFYDYFSLVLPDDEAIFYPDGQPRVYLYPAALHLMSACYIQGELTCTTCHDAHGTARDVDLLADRSGVELCETCHGDVAADPVAHGHHRAGSVGNQCVQCHMPYHYVTGENLTDHRIASPAPENTVVNGVPNACNQCHEDKSAQWASAWAKQWYGDYQDKIVARTTAIANGQKGGGVAPLMKLVNDGRESAVWRATAASLLGGVEDARAVPALVEAMGDSHAMVRMKAAISLGRLGDVRGLPALLDALSDSARIVRVQVPFALMDIGYLPDGSAVGDAFRRALEEHRDVVYGVQGDDPGFHEGLGQVYEAQGLFEDARREFEIVAKLDPRHPETAADLARLAQKQKRFEQMRALLREKSDLTSRLRAGALLLHHGRYADAAVAFDDVRDGSPVLHTAVGNALWGSGDRADAIEAYRRALAIASGYKPAIRQLALLAFSAGDGEVRDDYEWDEMPIGDWVERGTAHALSGDWALARAAYHRALEMEDAGTGLFGLGRQARDVGIAKSDSVFAAGHRVYVQGALADALPHFEVAVKYHANRADVYAMQGLIRADLGELEVAESLLLDALIVDPFYVPALTVLGTVLQERGDIGGALSVYRQAWVLEPEAQGLELFMGQAYAISGQRDSAVVILRRVIAREPGNVQVRDLLRELEGREL